VSVHLTVHNSVVSAF